MRIGARVALLCSMPIPRELDRLPIAVVDVAAALCCAALVRPLFKGSAWNHWPSVFNSTYGLSARSAAPRVPPNVYRHPLFTFLDWEDAKAAAYSHSLQPPYTKQRFDCTYCAVAYPLLSHNLRCTTRGQSQEMRISVLPLLGCGWRPSPFPNIPAALRTHPSLHL